MKLAIAIILLLCAFAVSIVVGLLRHAHVDTAGQGVLLLDAATAAECVAGGGCAAWSLRELKILYLHGAQSCRRSDV